MKSLYSISEKNRNCNITNDQLGKMIWIWLRDRGAVKTEKDKPYLWVKFTDNTDELNLPKTAAQFEFNKALLPELYNYLDSILS